MACVDQKKLGDQWATLGVILSVAAMLFFGYVSPSLFGTNVNILGWNWALVLVSMLAFTAILGKRSNGRIPGILITSRKLMSLSRFQIVIWTIVILSAYLTIVLERIHASAAPFAYNTTLNSTLINDPNLVTILAIPDPLGVGIEWQLWAIMGISTVSLVGTPLVLDRKEAKKPDKDVAAKTVEDIKTNKAQVETTNQIEKNSEGTVYANECISDAEFTDIFEGDELGNTAFIDLSKVQMFLFTIIAAFAYMFQIYTTIRYTHPAFITSLPVLSEGLIAILLISHAGYLTNKSIDHTKLG